MRLADLLDLGTSAEMLVEARRRVVFSNAVYLVVGGLLLAFNIIRINNLINPGTRGAQAYIPLAIVFISAICLFLNKNSFFLFAKVVFVLSWIALIIVYPVIAIGPGPTTYFMHPYFSIIFSPVVHLLFSFKNEKLFYLIFLAIFFLLAAFSLDFLLMFDRSPNPQVPLLKTITGFRINLIIFWLFLNLLMIYVLRINAKLYEELESKNELIRIQNVTLDNQSIQLSQQNKVLEEKVDERTLSLKEQNMKLREYAFMHSHILRAPITRLKGLINLLGMVKEEEEKSKIIELINKGATELENVAASMSRKLNEREE
jgi:hypothetical protein